ncbi:GSTM3 [Cordylochernes scorpioides]|uniref:glutathione transferase n=1 Tax=Cordylochernes scorpioides TaxID=51811 RepID=A0ABY6LM87_9ARAC|nr:GSTM3 [Cordylochernes scorpioides]
MFGYYAAFYVSTLSIPQLVDIKVMALINGVGNLRFTRIRRKEETEDDEVKEEIMMPTRGEVIAALKTLQKLSKTSADIDVHFEDDLNKIRRECLKQLAPGFHRRVKAKTSFQDDDVPIDDDTTRKQFFTPQEKGRKELLPDLKVFWQPLEGGQSGCGDVIPPPEFAEMAPTLGYWDIRGLGSPLRYLLHHVGQDFEDQLYTFGPAPDYSRDSWLSVKYTLGLDFPNLPYYIDGEVKLTQSTAILRYLARKHGLNGKTEEENQQLDLLEQQFDDLRWGVVRLCYDPNCNNLKDDYFKELPEKLKLFAEYLQDKSWFLGDRITYVDFLAYDALDFHRVIKKDSIDDFPNLVDFLKRFEELPAIHYESEINLAEKGKTTQAIAKGDMRLTTCTSEGQENIRIKDILHPLEGGQSGCGDVIPPPEFAEMAPTLGYWDIRGLGSPLRYLLHHVGQDFEDQLYTFGPAPDYSRDSWLSVKYTLGLDFPNLPYYIDGEVKLTQSTAILRYLARKHGLNGKTEEENQQLDLLEQQFDDLRWALARLCYDPNCNNLKDDYFKELPEKLKLFAEYLQDKSWFLGDRITYVDFLAYDALDFHRVIKKDSIDDFPNLVDFLKRFEELPAIRWKSGSDVVILRRNISKMAAALGYWDIRGLASSIRYLLHYVDQDFDDHVYPYGPAPEYSRDSWLKVKYTLGLDFPNLPYYIDGNVKLTQSNAILRYLARKHGLNGKSEEETQQLEVLEQQFNDLRWDMGMLCYDPNFENLKDQYLKELPEKLKLYAEYLQDKSWFLGDRITYVDFLAYDALDFQRALKKDSIDDFPNLVDYLKRFEELPAISKYMNSSKFNNANVDVLPTRGQQEAEAGLDVSTESDRGQPTGQRRGHPYEQGTFVGRYCDQGAGTVLICSMDKTPPPPQLAGIVIRVQGSDRSDLFHGQDTTTTSVGRYCDQGAWTVLICSMDKTPPPQLAGIVIRVQGPF